MCTFLLYVYNLLKLCFSSRDCQKADWPSHKKLCVSKSTPFSSGPLNSALSAADMEHRQHYTDDGSIFGEG